VPPPDVEQPVVSVVRLGRDQQVGVALGGLGFAYEAQPAVYQNAQIALVDDFQVIGSGK
jgi:hypothetical protein